MRFCSAHWGELRDAIRDRGLWGFVASSGEAVASRVAAGGFEPLLGAHNAIVGNALSTAGLAIMANQEDGSDRCPLCYLIETCECGRPDCSFTTWVTRAADEQLAEARRRGLVGVA